MANAEKVPIIKGDDLPRKASLLRCTHFIIVPLAMAFCVPLASYSYIIPEYIHDRLSKADVDMSVLHNYTYDACDSNKSGPEYEHYTHVQEEIAKWQNYFSLTRGIPSILTNLVWVSYSDVIGRRMLLFVCTLGYCLKFVGITLVVHFKAPFAYLLIGEAIDGLTGSNTTFYAVLFSFIADITELGQRRTIGIVLGELMLGLTYTAVTFGIGYYIKAFGYFYTSLTGVCCASFAILTAVILLPETNRHRKPGSISVILSGISEPFKLYCRSSSKRRQIKYLLLLAAFLLYGTQGMNRGPMETLYQLGRPFCWSSTKIARFGAARMGCISILGIITIIILKRVLADDTIGVISSVVTLGSFVVEAFAKSVAVLYTVPLLGMVSLLPIPIIRSIMSHLTPKEKQGAMFASIGAIEMVSSTLGALTGNLVYSATLSIMDGFVFLVLGALAGMTAIILLIYRWFDRRYPETACGETKGLN